MGEERFLEGLKVCQRSESLSYTSWRPLGVESKLHFVLRITSSKIPSIFISFYIEAFSKS